MGKAQPIPGSIEASLRWLLSRQTCKSPKNNIVLWRRFTQTPLMVLPKEPPLKDYRLALNAKARPPQASRGKPMATTPPLPRRRQSLKDFRLSLKAPPQSLKDFRQSFKAPLQSLKDFRQSLKVPPQSLKDFRKSLKVPAQSLKVPPQSLKVFQKILKVFRQILKDFAPIFSVFWQKPCLSVADDTNHSVCRLP